MQLQPVAVDKTAGKGDGGRGLKQLLARLAEEIKKDGKKAAQMPAIRGLMGDEAVSKVMHFYIDILIPRLGPWAAITIRVSSLSSARMAETSSVCADSRLCAALC